MTLTLINLNNEENLKVQSYSKLWKLNKQEIIRKMIREYKDSIIDKGDEDGCS